MGPRMLHLEPMASQLVLDLVYAQVHRVPCPTFNLDLAGPENANLLQSKTLNTKSRQGTGTF